MRPRRRPRARQQALAEVRIRFDQWLEARRRTLLWRLGSGCAAGTSLAWADFDAAGATFQRLQDELAGQQVEAGDLNRELHRRVILAALLLVLTVGVVVAFLRSSLRFALLLTTAAVRGHRAAPPRLPVHGPAPDAARVPAAPAASPCPIASSTAVAMPPTRRAGSRISTSS